VGIYYPAELASIGYPFGSITGGCGRNAPLFYWSNIGCIYEFGSGM